MEKNNNWDFSQELSSGFLLYIEGALLLCVSCGWLFYFSQLVTKLSFWIPYATLLFFWGASFFLYRQGILEKKIPYILSLLVNVMFITLFLYLVFGGKSDLYLFYFLLIGASSYHFGVLYGLYFSFLVTVLYLAVNLPHLSSFPQENLGIRLLLFWFLGITPGFLAKSAQTSKKQLIRTFDLLNERTSELEKSQVQIETIYESSRTLGEILKLNQIIEEILNISTLILGYSTCSVYLLEPNKNKLLLKGKIERGKPLVFDAPKEVVLSGVIEKVAKTAKPEIIFDLATAPFPSSESEAYRSQMIAPMLSQGKVVGVLETKSTKVGGFSSQDQKTFSILASSAGMAIENGLLHQKTEELTIKDELTGIYNYRFFVQKLEDELKRAKRYRQPLSLLMVDIDWFKKYNDNYGHLFGNQILKTLTGVIKSCVRDVDFFARYGGEEFVVILPQTSKDDAKSIGERIRQKVEQFEFKDSTETLLVKLTVSLGLATYPDNGETEEELTAKVDQALYLAKGKGKNLVCTL